MPNEELLLTTALDLTRSGQTEFHGYAMRELWESGDATPPTMNYATLYRCLDRLEQRGLLSSRYDVESTHGGPPRKLFMLTGDGLDAAVALSTGGEAGIEGVVPRVL